MQSTRYSTLRALGLLGTLCAVGLTATPASAQLIDRDDGMRLRLGAEIGAGGDWGTPRGPSVGLLGHVGAQFNNTFALYYQGSLIAHALGSGDNADIFAAWGNLAMADVTFGILQLGAGGGVDVGHFAQCGSGTCVDGTRLVQPALGGRIALVLALRTPRGRLGIPFAFHAHSTFLDNGNHLTSLLLTVGIQRF